MSSSKRSKNWKDKVLEDMLKRSDIIEGSFCKYHDQTTITNNSNDVPLRRERIFEKTIYRTSKIDNKNCKPSSELKVDTDKLDDDFSLDQRELIAEIDKKLKHLQSQKRCLQMARKRKKTKTWSEYLSANQPEEKSKGISKEQITDRKQRLCDKNDFHVCEVLYNLLEGNRIKVTDSSTQMEPTIDSRKSRAKSSPSPRSKTDRAYKTKNVSQNVRMTSSCSLISNELSSTPFSKRSRVNSNTQAGPSYLYHRRQSPRGRSTHVKDCLSEKHVRGVLPKNMPRKWKEPQTLKTNCKTRALSPQCRSFSPKAMKNSSGQSLEKDRNAMSHRSVMLNKEKGTLVRCRTPPESPHSKVLDPSSLKGKFRPNQKNCDSSRITIKSQSADNASTQDSTKFKRSPCERTESLESYSFRTMKFRHKTHSSSISSEMAEEITKFKQALKRFQSMNKHTPRASSYSDGETLKRSPKYYENERGRSSTRNVYPASSSTPTRDLKVVKPKVIDDTTYVLPDSEETADYIVLPYTSKTNEEINVNRVPKEQEGFSKNMVNKATVLLEDASSEKSRSNSSISFDISLNIKSIDLTTGTGFVLNQPGRIQLDSELGSPRSQNRENRATHLKSESGNEPHLNDSQPFREHQIEFPRKTTQSDREVIDSASASKPKRESAQLSLAVEQSHELSSSPRLQETSGNQYINSSRSNEEVPKSLKSEPPPESSQIDKRCMSYSLEYIREPIGKASKSTQCCYFEDIDCLLSQRQSRGEPKTDRNEMVDKPLSFDTTKDSNQDSKTENKPQSGLKKQKTHYDLSHPQQNSLHTENVSFPPEAFRGLEEEPNSSNAKYISPLSESIQDLKIEKQQTDPVSFHQEPNSSQSRNDSTPCKPFGDPKIATQSQSDFEKQKTNPVSSRQEWNSSPPQNVSSPSVSFRDTNSETKSQLGFQKQTPDPVSIRQEPIPSLTENVSCSKTEKKSQLDIEGQNTDVVSSPEKTNSSHFENVSSPTMSFRDVKAENKTYPGVQKQTPDTVSSHQKSSSSHTENISSPSVSFRDEKTKDKPRSCFKIQKTDLVLYSKENSSFPCKPFQDSKTENKSLSRLKMQKIDLISCCQELKSSHTENVSSTSVSFRDLKIEKKSQSCFEKQKTSSVPSRQDPNSSHSENVSSLSESLRNKTEKKSKSGLTKQKRYQSSSRQESCPARSKNASSISESFRVVKKEKKSKSGLKKQKRYPDPNSSNSECGSSSSETFRNSIENKSQLYFKEKTTDPVLPDQESSSFHEKIVTPPSEPLQSVSQKQNLSNIGTSLPSRSEQSLKSDSSDNSESSQIGKPVENKQPLPEERHLGQPKACSSIENTLDVRPKDTKPSQGIIDASDSAIMPKNCLQSNQSYKINLNENNDSLGKPFESGSLTYQYESSPEEVFLSETRHDDFHIEGVDSELLKYIQYLQDRLRDCDEMVKKQKFKCEEERKESCQNSAVFKAKQQAPYDGLSSERSEKCNLVGELMKEDENWSKCKKENKDEPESPLESNRTSESQLDFENSYQSSGGAENVESASDCSEIPPFTGCDCMKEGYYKIMHIAYKK